MDRNIRLLAAHNFLTDLKFHSAVLVLYFAQVTGSYALAMSIFSFVYISGAAFEIPTGVLSDRIGRKATLILGSVFAFLSALLYAAGGNYLLLVGGAVAEGVSRAFYSGNNQALLYDSLTASGQEKRFAKILGKTSAFFQLALAVGAVLGSFGAAWSFSLIMWGSVIPQFLCIAISLFVKEPPRQAEAALDLRAHLSESFKLLLTHRKLRLVSLQNIFSFGINEATFQFRAAFIAAVWPIWAVGISKFLSYAAATASFYYSGAIIDRVGAMRALLLSRIYGRIIGFLSYGFPGPLSPLLISTTSVFYGTVTVASDSYTQRYLKKPLRATIPSVVSFAGSIFIGIFSLILGKLADVTGPARALLIAEICSSGILIIVYRLYREEKDEYSGN